MKLIDRLLFFLVSKHDQSLETLQFFDSILQHFRLVLQLINFGFCAGMLLKEEFFGEKVHFLVKLRYDVL